MKWVTNLMNLGSNTIWLKPDLHLHHPPGGTLISSAYVGSGPASTVHPPQNIRNSKHPKKKYLKFYKPQKYALFCTLTLRKDPKCIEMAPNYSPIVWWPPKNSHKIFIPQKIFIFLKTPKNIEIQNFDLPPKKNQAYDYVCMKISRVPPWAPSTGSCSQIRF